MGGSSSSSSSTSKKETTNNDNSRTVNIDDDRAAVSDGSLSISGDTSGDLQITGLSPQVAAELSKITVRGLELSENAITAGFEFAEGVAEDDAKEFFTNVTKWGLLAGVSVAGLWFWSRKG